MQQISQTEISTQQAPRKKNQHVKNSMNRIIFTRRKINVQISKSEKSTCNRFNEPKKGQHVVSSTNKY